MAMKYAVYDGYPCVMVEPPARKAWAKFGDAWTEIPYADAFVSAGLMSKAEFENRWPQAGLPNAARQAGE